MEKYTNYKMCKIIAAVCLIVFVFNPVLLFSKQKELSERVLQSSLAGTWYSADANILAAQVDGLFQKNDAEKIKNIVALILPHAGYQYSGPIAAAGIKSARNNYKRIIIIGPSHRAPIGNILSVPWVTHYQTPFGKVPLDTDFIAKLLESPSFGSISQAHSREHSVQIEVPLLQRYMKDGFKIVPIVVGNCDLAAVKKAGVVLRSLITDDTLIVISSDFVHFGPNYRYVPFKDNVPENIKKLDMEAFEYISRLDAKGLLEYKEITGATICGCVPIAVLLSMLKDATVENDTQFQVDLIKYDTSGNMMNDYVNSVSYLSAAFVGSWPNLPETKTEDKTLTLTEGDKEQLLRLARKTIEYYFDSGKVPEPSQLGIDISEAMKVSRAAFVTLKKHSRLRGCIGEIYPSQPLYKSVIYNTINAGTRDRRFSPVVKAELEELHIEISWLTNPEPVDSPSDIRLGTDGVIMIKEGRSAVFLPQVATEQGWNLEQMLSRLSRKAGLSSDAWKKGTEFLVFQAVVFGEKEK